jgi:hypothetical protein
MALDIAFERSAQRVDGGHRGILDRCRKHQQRFGGRNGDVTLFRKRVTSPISPLIFVDREIETAEEKLGEEKMGAETRTLLFSEKSNVLMSRLIAPFMSSLVLIRTSGHPS